MGKKRIIRKSDEGGASEKIATLSSRGKKTKRKISAGIMHIGSTYNNTIINFTDTEGNSIFLASAGSLGFKGAKKGTPFAASKVAEVIAERSKSIGLSEVGIYVSGVGAGRESAIRSLAANGLAINFIKDVTPVPHNGTKPQKVRRV